MSDAFPGLIKAAAEAAEPEPKAEPELTPEEIEIRRVNAEADAKRRVVHDSQAWKDAQDLVFKHMHAADRAAYRGDAAEAEKCMALKAQAIAARDALVEGI